MQVGMVGDQQQQWYQQMPPGGQQPVAPYIPHSPGPASYASSVGPSASMISTVPGWRPPQQQAPIGAITEYYMPRSDPPYESWDHSNIAWQNAGEDSLSWTLGAIVEAPEEPLSEVIGAVSGRNGKVRFMVDSGSPVTGVRPSSFSSAVSKSSSGRYTDVNGRPISQRGTQSPTFSMPSGRLATVKADVLDITKDILGVANTADQGNWTIFGPNGVGSNQFHL